MPLQRRARHKKFEFLNTSKSLALLTGLEMRMNYMTVTYFPATEFCEYLCKMLIQWAVLEGLIYVGLGSGLVVCSSHGLKQGNYCTQP